jgi:hypothetical protein
MATSGVTAWSLTARDIITASLRETGIIGVEETPTAAEADLCLLRLNALLKSWSFGKHLETTGTVTITANSQSGTIDPSINEVLSARVIEGTDYERQLTRWERDEYFRLPNKASSGRPTAFFADKRLDAIVLYIWPVPTEETQIRVDYLRLPQTVTALSETVDIPSEYQEALFANLAVQCAGIFGQQPSGELVQRAAMLKRSAEDRERPASYMLGQF